MRQCSTPLSTGNTRYPFAGDEFIISTLEEPVLWILMDGMSVKVDTRYREQYDEQKESTSEPFAHPFQPPSARVRDKNTSWHLS